MLCCDVLCRVVWSCVVLFGLVVHCIVLKCSIAYVLLCVVMYRVVLLRIVQRARASQQQVDSGAKWFENMLGTDMKYHVEHIGVGKNYSDIRSGVIECVTPCNSTVHYYIVP